MREYLVPAQDVLKECGADEEQGLGVGRAAELLEQNGPNRLKEAEKDPLWKRFFQQMADPMVIMLIIAAVISALTGIVQGEADFADVIIIMFVVVLNSVLGVVQEAKSEEALAALQEMAAATSKVVRDGKVVSVPSSELVVGDIVILEAGDSVPADCRILESASMKIEEAALTGESVPATKHAEVISLEEGADDVPLGDRKNMCYMGSTVVFGRGRAVVVACGMDTEMGKIADALAQAEEGQTPLQVKLDELSRALTILVVAISAIVFLTGFVKHGLGFISDLGLVLNTFMIAVSLAVAAIPEGLVAVVTIVLSMGVTKMSEKNAIIRKLSAVETLGCTQIICSDKTGTLTQNKMTVVEHATEDLTAHVRTMALASDAKWDDAEGVATGEPTEAALVADAAKEGYTTTKLAQSRPRVGEAPFDSGRKMMSVVVRDHDGYEQHTKGGPDVVLARCTRYMSEDGVVPMTDELRRQVMDQNKAMADRALRVMASARRDWGKEMPESFEPGFLEQDLTFVGLSGMIDPVRPEVKAAIEEAHSAGIRVVMITGDHIDTAVAIARELGIIESREQAITGAELDRISDEDLADEVERFGVYARVQPEHKVRIVDAWKKKDKVVAMTGDGVNDAPSIKKADIGVGMGITGTDVTKNVADMVLADDNFATIINACEEGRRIYDNIRKCIQFLLSSNLAEVITVFVASLMGFTLLEPTHLLWINLITDSLPALAMATEGAEPNIMERQPRDSKDGIFSNGMGLDTIVQGTIISVLTLVAYFIGLATEGVSLADVVAGNGSGLEGMTMAFLTLSMVEMFHSLNMRSRRESVFTLKKQNFWLWGAFVVALLLTFVVIETPLSEAFDFAELDLVHYAISMGLAALIIPIVELEKAIMRRVDKAKA
ncbi:cation-translocating P-type ATPase [Olsenella sp. DNF00959]|uniref:cation-translocating P-type ATPase n=1 Tax=Olsenella sp. DNF00959 TaxID=1476999 RepID=UPI00078357C3|nr:cation-translocating P-type ATPase [Olsenella sp. DNF00959]KXB63270.1 putative potassium/sodium efflux P-type ATPase, fungal-type [Olsenella sp. DNF00959]